MTDVRGAATARVLIAGVGNVLRGDDGFGPAVVAALQDSGRLPDGVRVVEVGIGGMNLVHELMAGYDTLVLVDAVERGGQPGALYVLDATVPELATIPELERWQMATDMHEAVPSQALLVASAVGALPPVIRIVGCQPGETDDFALELSEPVRQAIPAAIDAIMALLEPRDERQPAMRHGRVEGNADEINATSSKPEERVA